MNKIEKVHPVTPSVVSNRVIISNKVFRELVECVNNIVETTNNIIDTLSNLENDLRSIDNTHTNAEAELQVRANTIQALATANQESVQALAAAIQTLTNLQ